MLFAKVLLALPFIGAVFASPITKSVAVEKRDVDILAIVTDLKASIDTSVLGINVLSTEAEVTDALTAVLLSLNNANSAISADQAVAARDIGSELESLKRQIGGTDLVDQVANILAGIIQSVDGLVNGIAAELQTIPLIAGLLAQLSPALGLVLAGVDLVLAGVLLLVGQILGALGLNLNPILGSLNGLLGGLLGGLLA